MNQYTGILEAFEKLAELGRPVRLINNYKGLPVTYDATIEDISDGLVTLGIHNYQAVCLELHRHTLIKIEGIPEIIDADVIAVDLLKDRAMLANFRSKGRDIGERTRIRVHPRDPITVLVFVGDIRIKGYLADISVVGMGVYRIVALMVNPQVFRVNTNVAVSFQINNALPAVKINGKIVATVDVNGFVRLGVRLLPSGQDRETISEYVGQRQADIHRELGMMYDLLARLRSDDKNMDKPSG